MATKPDEKTAEMIKVVTKEPSGILQGYGYVLRLKADPQEDGGEIWAIRAEKQLMIETALPAKVIADCEDPDAVREEALTAMLKQLTQVVVDTETAHAHNIVNRARQIILPHRKPGGNGQIWRG